MRIGRTLPFCAFTLLLSAPLSAQHFPSESELTALIQGRVAEGRAVGIVLGVMEADGSVRVITAGDAGPDARPLSDRSVFEIGSITKVFTGILLAERAQRGEVRMSDPVSMYLPDRVRVPTRNAREITLLDLATHHSSLPQLPNNMARADPANPYADYTVEQLYAFLSEHELRRDIGLEYEYSNLGVGLLGHVLAAVDGASYEEVIRERILDPLGMDHTGIILEGEMGDWMAQGHNREGAVVPLWDLPTLAGAGALRSDLRDMLRFLAANIGEPDTELERAMRTTHLPRRVISERMSLGLNWHIRSVGESRIIWHNGGTAGFRTFIGFDPDREVGAVVLTNSAHGADDIGFHLINPEISLAKAPPEGAVALVMVGLLTFILGLFGIVRPATLSGFTERAWKSPRAIPAAVMLSVLLGALLLVFASDTRFPVIIGVLGCISLLKAVSWPFIGRFRLSRLIEWWQNRPTRYVRAWSVVAVAYGVFLVFAGM